jgi:hypothetical protein
LRAPERSRSRTLLALALLLCATSCQTAPPAAHANAAPAATHENAERELASAQDKLAIAKLQQGLAESRASSSRARKEAELQFARGELSQFAECDGPSQIAKSKLELTRRRDALAEQQEELAQLEMLYEKQDLADKTREIVLQRGKRRVERAQEELAIAERDAATLESQSLPRQRARLELEVEAKARELDEQGLEIQAARLEKGLALREAEAALQAAQEKAAAGGAKP